MYKNRNGPLSWAAMTYRAMKTLLQAGGVCLAEYVTVKDRSSQLRIEDHFGFRTFWTKFCNILKYGMILKFETNF